MEDWSDMKGLPWNLKPQMHDAPRPLEDPTGPWPGVLPRAEGGVPEPKAFYVRRGGIKKFGATGIAEDVSTFNEGRQVPSHIRTCAGS